MEEGSRSIEGVLEALKMAENSEKRCFTFFAFLPPYIGVSGSRICQRKDILEIYRLVSKNLSFTACGSVFEKSAEHRSRIYRKSIEIPSSIYRTSIEDQSNICRTSVEIGERKKGMGPIVHSLGLFWLPGGWVFIFQTGKLAKLCPPPINGVQTKA